MRKFCLYSFGFVLVSVNLLANSWVVGTTTADWDTSPEQNPVIFIFGPSCSGKSTLSKALVESLGEETVYISSDDMLEADECSEEDLGEAIEEVIESLSDQNIVVDTQLPLREKKEDEINILLLPPLDILLERDAKRAERLSRSEKRAYWARHYVIETYEILSALDQERFDCVFDSSSMSTECMVSGVLAFLKTRALKQNCYAIRSCS